MAKNSLKNYCSNIIIEHFETPFYELLEKKLENNIKKKKLKPGLKLNLKVRRKLS